MIRPKKRVRRVFWRTGRIREDAAGVRQLRMDVFLRAEGRCEIKWDGKRCNKFAPWDGFGHGELVHLKPRNDIREACQWGCHECHSRRDHPGPQWSNLIRGKEASA